MMREVSLLAHLMPFNMLLDKLEEALANFKADPTERNKHELGFTCMLFTVHVQQEGRSLSEIEAILNRTEDASDLAERLRFDPEDDE